MAEFKADPAGIRAMLASREMGDAMVRRAERGKEFAMSIAPVDTGRYKYGAFLLTERHDPGGHRRRKAGGNLEALGDGDRGGFEVSRTVTPEGWSAARLTALASYSRYLEFGTRFMAAQHILGRSMDAMR